MLGEGDIIKLDYLKSLSPKTTIALLLFDGHLEIMYILYNNPEYVYTIMCAKDGHVTLEMDNEISCNTAL